MTFIKIKDLDLALLKGRWDEGDKFAFIEAIAYCAARGREYPDWVRAQIDIPYRKLCNMCGHGVFRQLETKKSPSGSPVPALH